ALVHVSPPPLRALPGPGPPRGVLRWSSVNGRPSFPRLEYGVPPGAARDDTSQRPRGRMGETRDIRREASRTAGPTGTRGRPRSATWREPSSSRTPRGPRTRFPPRATSGRTVDLRHATRPERRVVP